MANLELRTSTISKAGNGLFIGDDVKKGDVLGEYSGRRFSPTKILSGTKKDYTFSTYANVIVSPHDHCLFRYANDIIDLEKSISHRKIVKHAHLSYNIGWRIDKEQTRKAKEMAVTLGKGKYLNTEFLNLERVYIVATQDIAAGSELFIDYGDGYWNTRITNSKSRRQLKSDLFRPGAECITKTEVIIGISS